MRPEPAVLGGDRGGNEHGWQLRRRERHAASAFLRQRFVQRNPGAIDNNRRPTSSRVQRLWRDRPKAQPQQQRCAGRRRERCGGLARMSANSLQEFRLHFADAGAGAPALRAVN
jgi:hypothetical protein